jgi:hypothetical protein
MTTGNKVGEITALPDVGLYLELFTLLFVVAYTALVFLTMLMTLNGKL